MDKREPEQQRKKTGWMLQSYHGWTVHLKSIHEKPFKHLLEITIDILGHLEDTS